MERELSEILTDKYGDRYKVLGEIGKGGMGVVYEVADNDIKNRKFAVKKIKSGIIKKNGLVYFCNTSQQPNPPAGTVERFKHEIEIAASLKSAFIVNIYGEPCNFDPSDPDNLFYSMELIEGKTLQILLENNLERNAELDFDELRGLLKLFREILDAVAWAHKNNIVHCDLKPENIMINSDGHIKVTDFGIAFCKGENQKKGGTYGYIAPEILKNGQGDHRADIYSLGVILNKLLFGRSRCNNSRDKFDDIIDKMWQENPANRYQNIEDIIRDLKVAEEELCSATRNDLSLVGLKSSDFAVGSYVTFGRYPQNNSDTPEPIEWLVLRNNINQALLVSKYGLECLPFHYVSADIGWCDCDLRKWLNDVFFNRAFNVDEQRCILESVIYTNDNDAYSIKGCGETLDKVFCLSTEEAKHFFSSRKQRKCKPTAYAVSNGAFEDNDTGCCWYWLRSPGSRARYAARVRSIGAVTFSGSNVFLANGAVRPALRIKL
ncbi:MAG: serine/threonine protein kinase [bacterium]|nr:serine/threonine protein kinase [bacterium]